MNTQALKAFLMNLKNDTEIVVETVNMRMDEPRYVGPWSCNSQCTMISVTCGSVVANIAAEHIVAITVKLGQ